MGGKYRCQECQGVDQDSQMSSIKVFEVVLRVSRVSMFVKCCQGCQSLSRVVKGVKVCQWLSRVSKSSSFFFFRNRPMVFFLKHHITIAPPLSSPWLPEGRVTTRPKGWSGRVLRVVDLRGPPTPLAPWLKFNSKTDEVTPRWSSTWRGPPPPLIS